MTTEVNYKVKESEITFQKITICPKKGVDFHCFRTYALGGEPNTSDYSGWDDRFPHPNLTIPLRQNLRGFAVDVMEDVDLDWLLKDAPNQNELSEIIKLPKQKRRERLIKGMVINSITKTGEKDWVSVVIEGTRTLHKGDVQKFKTPAIKVSTEGAGKYGWEPDLKAELEVIEHEAYLYKFEYRSGDPALSDIDGNHLENLPQDENKYEGTIPFDTSEENAEDQD